MTLVAATAVASTGENYAHTYIERLRSAGGHRDAAPRPKDLGKLGAITGSAMVAIGVGVLIWGGADTVGIVFLIMAIRVALWAIHYSFAIILFAQHRDALRVRTTASVAVVKAVLLFPVVHFFGVYGAAVVGVLCEFVLVAVYYRKIYHSRSPTDPVTTPGLFNE